MDDPSAIELVRKIRNCHGQFQVKKVPWEKYKWIKFIGKGAFGKVDLYQNQHDKALVAFKEIDLQCLSGIERRKAMGEVQVLSMLNHPNIVTYLNSYEFEGRLVIEMEYCEHGSLADFLAQQITHLSEKIILRMFSQIAAALLYLEQKNILHRDMKTANILIARCHVLKVGDFGIAQVLSTRKIDASTVIGTPYSFSPELCEGKRYTNKSDIWAAGCILYEMTCLQRTFDAKNMPALVQKIVKGQMAPIRGNYSVGLRKLIKDLLALQPDLRPSAFELVLVVGELLDNQENMLDGIVTSASDTSAGQRIETISLIFEVKLCTPIIRLERLSINRRIVQISKSNSHTLLLTDSGDVYSLGSGATGALGLGVVTDEVTSPTQIKKLSKMVKVVAGDNFSLFRSSQGMLYSCGDFSSLCLGSSVSDKILFCPTAVGTLLDVDIADVASSDHHVVACTSDGIVYGWGLNSRGCLGMSESINSSLSPIPIEFPPGVVIVKVFAGEKASMFIDAFGRLWACGDNSNNRIGLGALKHSSVPRHVKTVKKFAISVSVNGDNSRVLLREFQIQILGHPTICNQKKELLDLEILDVKCGKQFTVAMTPNQLYFYGKRERLRRKGERDPNPCTMIGDVAIGSTNYSLMDIVQDVGPDYSVIQVNDPRVSIETMADLETFDIGSRSIMVTDYISKPQAIISLYSCQRNKQRSQYIHLSQIYCFRDDTVWIVFDSNLISPGRGESPELDDRTLIWSHAEETLTDNSQVPEWIQRELKEADCDSPSIDHHSDPTFDRGRKEVAMVLVKKLAHADEEVRNLRRQQEELQIQVSRLQEKLRSNNDNCCKIL